MAFQLLHLRSAVLIIYEKKVPSALLGCEKLLAFESSCSISGLNPAKILYITRPTDPALVSTVPSCSRDWENLERARPFQHQALLACYIRCNGRMLQVV